MKYFVGIGDGLDDAIERYRAAKERCERSRTLNVLRGARERGSEGELWRGYADLESRTSASTFRSSAHRKSAGICACLFCCLN